MPFVKDANQLNETIFSIPYTFRVTEEIAEFLFQDDDDTDSKVIVSMMSLSGSVLVQS